ncbi:MAG: glycosyltransferase [Candidatus Omnitrophota bacterium]
MKKPFYSVLIPTYNRSAFLRIALQSVLRQTYSDFEIIIIDDGSTDTTADVVDEYRKNSNQCIWYLYQENRGPAAARNRGLALAQGTFICFLDSDDRFLHSKLQRTTDYIGKNPHCKIFHTEEIWYRNGEYLPQKAYHAKPSSFVFKNSTRLCSISISTAVVHKDIFSDIGTFDERLPACEDYDFWLRATAVYPVLLIPEYLTIKEGGRNDQQSKKYPLMDGFRVEALKKILTGGTLDKKNRAIALNELKTKCEILINGAHKRGLDADVVRYRAIIETLQASNNERAY